MHVRFKELQRYLWHKPLPIKFSNTTMVMIIIALFAAISLSLTNNAVAFNHSITKFSSTLPFSSTSLHAANSRRDLFARSGFAVGSTLLTWSSINNVAYAAGAN